MAGQPMELAALILSILGLIGVSASTGMPMWRVTAFIGENIIVMETRYEGLWMNCYRQANIRMQCKVYDSLLALTPDLQAARGLMCCSVALAGLGILIAITGLKCTACIQGNDNAKRIVVIVAGSVIILACFCSLIPVSWTGHVIIQDFYNPLLIDAQRRELGEALYIGWVSSAFLFAGGCIFVCCTRSNEDQSRYKNKRDVPYVAYQPQPQPLAYQPRSAAAYSYISREPSFVQESTQPSIAQTSRQQSFVYPSRQQSFVYPSGQQSFVQPVRHVSVRSGVAYL